MSFSVYQSYRDILMSVYLITDNVDLGSLVKWCLSGFSTAKLLFMTL